MCEALKLKGARKQNQNPENRERLGSFSRGNFELLATIGMPVTCIRQLGNTN